MRGSLYPDGVLVDKTALRRTEESKADEIKRNRTDLTSRGMYTGGEVTVNSVDNTKIDVAQLSGYTPNGEFIETSSDYYSIVLDDYTLNAVNYVCAVYTEDNVGNQPHESDGEVYPTEASLAWRIRVYEESVFNALESTDNNLANDAIDRCIIIAKVTANGASIALTTSNIFSPTSYNNVMYSDPVILSTITGVTVLSVSPGTPPGAGILHYDDTGAPNYTLQWQSITGGLGPIETFTVDEIRNIADGAGDYIRVQVNISQLPVISGTTTETITIYNLYYQEIPRLTGEDTYHRNLTGTGIIGPNNPHGLSVDDLYGEESQSHLEVHQDIQHCNGIWRGSYSSIFDDSLIINTPPGGDTLVIQAPGAGDLYYINGKKLSTLAPTSILFTPTNLATAALGSTVKEGSKLYEIYVDDDEALVANLRVDTNPATLPARTVTGCWIIDMYDEHPAGSYDLECIAITAGADATYRFRWGLNGGTYGLPITIDNSTLPTNQEGKVIRLYDSTGVNWIDVYVNCTASGPSPDAKLPSSAASPGTTYTDTITVYNHLDYDQNLKILSLLYWWDISRGTLGWETDFAGGGGDRHTIDKRQWGTLCINEIADEALSTLAYKSNDELQHSGILYARDEWEGSFYTTKDIAVADLTFPVRGGSCYLRGERLTVDSNLSINAYNNTTTMIYVDHLGVINRMDIGAGTIFNSSVVNAMVWLMGNSYYRPTQLEEEFAPFSENDLDYSEKGVPLYFVVASAGAVTKFVDISRNINGPVDPWSVGNRRNLSYDRSLAAFDSLESAFLHVEYWSKITSPDDTKTEINEIRVVGSCVILDGDYVDQPDGLKVTGSIYGSQVYIPGPITTGSWRLGDYCEVSYLNMIPTISDVSSTGLMFKLNDNSELHHLKIDVPDLSSGVTNDYNLFSLNKGGVAYISDVNIHHNIIYSPGCMFQVGDNLTTPLGISIHDNIIEGGHQVSSSTNQNGVLVIYDLVKYHEDIKIYRNKFTIHEKDDGSCDTSAINLTNVYNVSITNNIMFIEPSDPTASIKSYGIKIDGENIIIDSNFIYAGTEILPATTDVNVIGIYFGDFTNGGKYKVYGNHISYVEQGVQIEGRIDSADISRNTFDNIFVIGINIECITRNDGNMTGLKICDNIMQHFRRDSSSPVGVDDWSYGIYVFIDTDYGTSPASVGDIQINNNLISDLSSGKDDCGGIDLYIAGGATMTNIIRGIQINGNNIQELDPDSGHTAYYIKLSTRMHLTGPSITGRFISTLDVSNNNITCKRSVTTSAYGILTDLVDTLGGYVNSHASKICDNVIHLQRDDLGATYGIASLSSDTASEMLIEGNSIFANTIGIRNGINRSLISNNLINSGRYGIMLDDFGTGTVIDGNNVTVNLINATYDGVCIGVYCTYSLGFEDPGVTVSNNYTMLRADNATSVIDEDSCNIYFTTDSANFIIMNNITRQRYDDIGGTSMIPAHIFIDEDHAGVWTIQGNQVFNDHVIDGSSDHNYTKSHGIYISAVGSGIVFRGNIKDNVVWFSSYTTASTYWSLYTPATTSAGNQIITLSNNHFSCLPTYQNTGTLAPTQHITFGNTVYLAHLTNTYTGSQAVDSSNLIDVWDTGTYKHYWT